MPTILSTGYKRFIGSTTDGSVTGQINLHALNEGTASLADEDDRIDLRGPTQNSTLGSTSTFTDDLPQHYIITGIEYQIRMEPNPPGPFNSVQSRLLVVGSNSTTFGTATTTNGLSAFGNVITIGGPNNLLGVGSAINLPGEVNNLQLRIKHPDDNPDVDIDIMSKPFTGDGPYPAVKIYYYQASPKVTIVKQNPRPKLTIKGGTKVTIKQMG